MKNIENTIAKTDIIKAFTPNICKLEISLSSEPIL